MPKLTNKQRQFVAEYLVDLNATQAAIRAGYSENTARAIGQENLTKPDIAAEIQAALDARSKRTEITADRVLKELALIGFADMGTYLKLDGSVATLDWSDLPADATKVISEVTQEIVTKGDDAETVKRTKFKLHDKRAALVDIGKHLGMFIDRKEVGAPGDFEGLDDGQLDDRRRHIEREIALLEGRGDQAGGRAAKATTH